MRTSGDCEKGKHMTLEIAGWLVLVAFFALTAGLCELCERIVRAVEKRRDL